MSSCATRFALILRAELALPLAPQTIVSLIKILRPSFVGYVAAARHGGRPVPASVNRTTKIYGLPRSRADPKLSRIRVLARQDQLTSVDSVGL